MCRCCNWWAIQFVHWAKEVFKSYSWFEVTREVEWFDKAVEIQETLNGAYGLSLELLEYVKLGRAKCSSQLSPYNTEV